MVHRIPGNTAVDGPNAAMPRTACFPQNHIFVLGIANLTDRCVAIFRHAANFTRWQTNLGIALVPGHQCRRRSGAANNLPAFARVKLNVMNRDAYRYGAQRKAVAQIRCCFRTAHQLRTHLQSVGSNNVSLLSILILQKSEAGRADRIILDRGNGRFDAMLVAFEIDDADFLFVPATNATRRHASVMITATRLLADLDEALLRLRLRDLVVRRDRDVSRRRRQRSKCLHWHKKLTFPSLSLEQSDHQSCAQSGVSYRPAD